MIILKYATASQEVPLGPFVDELDGDTAETALTIANTDIKIWKAGATTLASKNSGGATHISNGVYYAVLDATDTNTLGSMALFVNVSGALPVKLHCHVLHAKVYDALQNGRLAFTDPDFASVAAALTWKLIQTSSAELVGDQTLVLDNDTGEKTFAVDFAVDLPIGGRINTVDNVEIASGTANGVTFGTSGREYSLAKIPITGVTAGTYTLSVQVSDNEGTPHTATVTLKVVE